MIMNVIKKAPTDFYIILGAPNYISTVIFIIRIGSISWTLAAEVKQGRDA